MIIVTCCLSHKLRKNEVALWIKMKEKRKNMCVQSSRISVNNFCFLLIVNYEYSKIITIIGVLSRPKHFMLGLQYFFHYCFDTQNGANRITLCRHIILECSLESEMIALIFFIFFK